LPLQAARYTTPADKADTAHLLERYGLTRELRTLDALHLAVMRRFRPTALDTVYFADRR
jgi:predicted nucleic acid-binding protein